MSEPSIRFLNNWAIIAAAAVCGVYGGLQRRDRASAQNRLHRLQTPPLCREQPPTLLHLWRDSETSLV